MAAYANPKTDLFAPLQDTDCVPAQLIAGPSACNEIITAILSFVRFHSVLMHPCLQWYSSEVNLSGSISQKPSTNAAARRSPFTYPCFMVTTDLFLVVGVLAVGAGAAGAAGAVLSAHSG